MAAPQEDGGDGPFFDLKTMRQRAAAALSADGVREVFEGAVVAVDATAAAALRWTVGTDMVLGRLGAASVVALEAPAGEVADVGRRLGASTLVVWTFDALSEPLRDAIVAHASHDGHGVWWRVVVLSSLPEGAHALNGDGGGDHDDPHGGFEISLRSWAATRVDYSVRSLLFPCPVALVNEAFVLPVPASFGRVNLRVEENAAAGRARGDGSAGDDSNDDDGDDPSGGGGGGREAAVLAHMLDDLLADSDLGADCFALGVTARKVAARLSRLSRARPPPEARATVIVIDRVR